MRSLRDVVAAGAAAIALGLSGAALAQNAGTHVMMFQLPGGGVGEIRYTGNVMPRIVIGTEPVAANAYWPVSLFAVGSPLAEMARMSAEMDREAARLLREAASLSARPWIGGLTEADWRNLPPGSESYSSVTAIDGSNFCSRSVQITSTGNGAPKVVTHSSGNCGPGGQAGAGQSGTGSVNLPTAPAPSNRPDMLWVNSPGAQPYAGLVRPAGLGR